MVRMHYLVKKNLSTICQLIEIFSASDKRKRACCCFVGCFGWRYFCFRCCSMFYLDCLGNFIAMRIETFTQSVVKTCKQRQFKISLSFKCQKVLLQYVWKIFSCCFKDFFENTTSFIQLLLILSVWWSCHRYL